MRLIVPFLIAISPVPLAYAVPALAHPSDGLSYMLLSGDGHNTMINGSWDDYRFAERYRTGNAPLLFVRNQGATYIIRDPAYLRRAEAIVAPQQKLGEQQGALGRQQGDLGRKQGKLGQEQARLGRMMADTPPRQMGELGRQQGELGRQQSALGAQQAALGKQQAALGKEQARLAELAKPQFQALVSEAIQRGVAQRVD